MVWRIVKYGSALLLALMLILAALLSYIYVDLGGQNSVHSGDYGRCDLIAGVIGAEDIEYDEESGIAYISADDRRGHLSKGEANHVARQAGIYRYITGPRATALERKRAPEPMQIVGVQGANSLDGVDAVRRILDNFHPHGISLFKQDGDAYLYVISHRQPEQPIKGHDIYLFKINGQRLELQAHIEHPLIHSPNDIAAISVDEFYISNDREALTAAAMYTEVLLGLGRGNVAHFKRDAKNHSRKSSQWQGRVVFEGLAFANGIAYQPMSNSLWVSESRAGRVKQFERKDSGELTLRQDLQLGNSLDNISVDTKGQLWLADHHNGVKQAGNASDPAIASPTIIWRLSQEGGATSSLGSSGSAKKVMQLSGVDYSAASVAVNTGKRLLLGSIYNEGILSCALP